MAYSLATVMYKEQYTKYSQPQKSCLVNYVNVHPGQLKYGRKERFISLLTIDTPSHTVTRELILLSHFEVHGKDTTFLADCTLGVAVRNKEEY